MDVLLHNACSLLIVSICLGDNADDFVEVSGHLDTVSTICILTRFHDPDVPHGCV